MIFSKWSWLFRKISEEDWKKEQIAKFEARHNALLTNQALQIKSAETEAYELSLRQKRNKELSEEFERKNEDLRTQIKLIEAKASPDQVWACAFSLGFSKAWDMMLPILYQGMDKVQTAMKNKAHDEAVRSLEPVIQKRIDELCDLDLKKNYEITEKLSELNGRISSAKTDQERLQVMNYIEAIKWVMNGDHP